MEQVKPSTKCAGIDAAKAKLDVAVHGLEDHLEVGNGPAGFALLAGWLEERGVGRVGIEASGGYERAVVLFLQARGLEVVVFQPAEVKAFGRFRRIRAKSDKIDARLIAMATAYVDGVKAAADPFLTELAERLTAYEQVSQQVAQVKIWLEHVTLPDLKAQYRAQLQTLLAWKKSLTRDLVGRIKQRPDLARRFALLMSLPGIGQIVAASLVIRMPELGAMDFGQAGCLLGVAPFVKDSGKSTGERHIYGGRARPRRMLYLAAIAAKRIDPGFRAFALRLTAAGKKPKVVITAVMRKLIEAANLVLKRDQPWTKTAMA